MRGYFAIGVYQPKNIVNIGTLWRSAYLLNAQFIFTIGSRYKKQPSDTYNSSKHIPLFEYQTFDQFLTIRPKDCLLVGIELIAGAELLDDYKHPQRALYLLGAEDNGLPERVSFKVQ